MKRIHYFLILAFAISIFSCTGEKIVEKPFVNPPLPALNPSFESYTFNAEKGDTLRYKTGSVISIPPEIWVDTAGNVITGEIKVKYREFHDAYDIFLAGVPMAYDSAGIKESLQTAGMFDIRAFKDSNEIFVKEGSNMNVKMASYDGNSDYNFYSLDEKAKNWAYKGTAEPEINVNIQLITDSITEMTPKVIIPFGEGHFALNYDAVLDVMFKNNAWKYQNNKSMKRKTEKYGLKSYAIDANFNQIFFKRRKVFAYEMVWKNISGKKIPSWLMKSKYSGDNYITKLSRLGNNNYYMTVQGPTKKYTLKVKAIMKLRDVFKQMPDDWQQELANTKRMIAEAEARLKAQASVFRSFNVNQTGYHNWDKISKFENKIYVEADFNFKNSELDKAGIPIVYFIENDKSYVQIPFQDWNKLMLVPDSTAKFVAILSETEIATFSNSEYQKLDFSALATNKKQVFDMKTVKINSKDDFLNSIN